MDCCTRLGHLSLPLLGHSTVLQSLFSFLESLHVPDPRPGHEACADCCVPRLVGQQFASVVFGVFENNEGVNETDFGF